MTQRLQYNFVWKWQDGFQSSFKHLAETTLKKIGIETELNCFLVCVLNFNRENVVNPIYFVPEETSVDLQLFSTLFDELDFNIQNHKLVNMFYGDSATMNDKPENIRRDANRISVKNCLKEYDNKNDVYSFCALAYPIKDFYVVPVLQIDSSIYDKYPLFEGKNIFGESLNYNLLKNCIQSILGEVHKSLHLPEPGRFSLSKKFGSEKEAGSINYNAADRLLYSISLTTTPSCMEHDLFDKINRLSTLTYENNNNSAKVIIANPEHRNIVFDIQFQKSIKLSNLRWVRKILEMSSSDISPIMDAHHIYGLGHLKGTEIDLDDIFIVEFLDHYYWQLKSNNTILLKSYYGDVSLPVESLPQDRFISNFHRLFPKAKCDSGEYVWDLYKLACEQKHGSMLVFVENAKEEVVRLQYVGTNISPTLMTKELFLRVSEIDGSIILDPNGICYAIGVILDGNVHEDCTPSRGSRYNSAIRYINMDRKNRFAIIISDDKSSEVYPLLMPQISREMIDSNIAFLQQSDKDNYWEYMRWLDKHRFYMVQIDCDVINNELERIEKFPLDLGEIRFPYDFFEPDYLMDDSYYL